MILPPLEEYYYSKKFWLIDAEPIQFIMNNLVESESSEKIEYNTLLYNIYPKKQKSDLLYSGIVITDGLSIFTTNTYTKLFKNMRDAEDLCACYYVINLKDLYKKIVDKKEFILKAIKMHPNMNSKEVSNLAEELWDSTTDEYGICWNEKLTKGEELSELAEINNKIQNKK